MRYELFVILPSLILAIINMRTLFAILRFRAPVVYVSLFFVAFVVDVACVIAGLPATVRTMVINPLSHIALPLACTTGPLRTRLVRIGVVWLVDPVAELTGFAILALLGQEVFFREVTASNLLEILVMYAMALLLYTLACELVITFFRRDPEGRDAQIAGPVLASVLVNTFLSYFLLARIASLSDVKRAFTMMATACSLAGILFSVLSLVIARRDVAIARNLADDAARTRQERHMTRHVLQVTTERRELLLFRHDLANQVEVIASLATTGRTQEALDYLATLAAKARHLEGESHD